MAKRRKFSAADRELVAQRAQGICEYCQCPQNFVPDAYELEHKQREEIAFLRSLLQEKKSAVQ